MHLSFREIEVLSDALERGLGFLGDFLVQAKEEGTLKNVTNLRTEVGSNTERGVQEMDKDLRIRVDSSIVVQIK